MTTIITTQLSAAAQGLLFLSESDAPFGVVHWSAQGKQLTPAILLQLTNHTPDAPIEVVSVDEFFAIATAEED